MRYVILGKGGHAQALVDAWFQNGRHSWRLVGPGEDIGECDWVLIGVGQIAIRRSLYGQHKDRVYNSGIQVMTRAFVSMSALLGENALINTGAQIDHDCVIGDHCVISPGAILCGNVTLGEACFVGAGAIIVEGVTLHAGSFVPAGSLVVGQDDLRVPQRVVFPDGARALGQRPVHPRQKDRPVTAGDGDHTNPQPA
jgi:carbonic anhydrase/acetyltransferase-like protein (isoleucine patch superfamily)